MSASHSLQGKLVVFADASNTRRVLLPLPNTYNAALELAHRHFPLIDFETIALQTDELEICRGERVYITAESWEQVVLHVSRLHVVSNPDADASMDDLTASETETVVDTAPKLSLNLRDCELRTLTIVIGYDTSMRKAMNAWMQHFDEPDSDPRFMIGYERRVTDRDTARGLGLRDGDVIDVFKKHVGGKPVIYLFSPVECRGPCQIVSGPSMGVFCCVSGGAHQIFHRNLCTERNYRVDSRDSS
ncbi:hypothetical protein QCA50_002841 [Cerrena zonata]|uniref:Ubiquitin-like domain-containing protein n=1 Tax=Cerrena zonata TaxID=2478898 RepID=A0AAW0GQC5_9APHY